MKNTKNKLDAFEIIYLAVSALVLLISALVLKSDLLTVLCAMLGILGSVLVGTGRKVAYFFSLASSLMYIFVSFRAGQYGETLLHAACVSPLYVYSIIKWYVRGRDSDSDDCFRLTKKQIAFFLALGVALTVVYGSVLKEYGPLIGLETRLPFLNSASTSLCLAAYILSAKRMREMWFAHLGANAVLITMWLLASDTDSGNMLIMIENILFVICNIRGLLVWNRLSAIQPKETT